MARKKLSETQKLAGKLKALEPGKSMTLMMTPSRHGLLYQARLWLDRTFELKALPNGTHKITRTA